MHSTKHDAVHAAKHDEGMQLPRRFARAALVYFIIVGILGTFLRARFVTPVLPTLQFTNVLHAHSHVAYFGWTSLGLMAVMYALLPRITGRPVVGQHLIRWQLAATHVSTVGALVSFAAGGYNVISIIFSTLNVLIWYLFMRIYWLNVRHLPRPLPVAVRYWHGAVFLLFVSSLGTWLISAMTARGGAGVGREAGLNIFLTNFTDGWLILGLFGAAAAWLSTHKVLHHRPGQWAAGPLPWIVVLTPFTFLAELVTFELPMGVLLVGLVARYALVVPYIWFLWNLRAAWQGARERGLVRGGGMQAFGVAAFAFFAAKAALHFVLGIIAVVPSRHMLVAYLHLDLLGFVSCGLLAALYLVFAAPEAWAIGADRGADSARGSAPLGRKAAPSGPATASAGQAGALFLSLGLVGMIVTLAATALTGAAGDAGSRQAAEDLLKAAFVFGGVSLIGIALGVVGLWPYTALMGSRAGAGVPTRGATSGPTSGSTDRDRSRP